MTYELEAEEFPRQVERAGSGDKQAIAWLWERHQKPLLGWLKSLDPSMAEDLAADTWVEAIRSSKSFRGSESAFRAWIFTIARRKLIDLKRREAKSADLLRRVGEPSTVAPDPAEMAIATESSVWAACVITASVTPSQAEVLLLRIVAGLDNDEVANILGRTPESVRVLAHRGLKRLSTSLQASSLEKIS